MVTMSGLYPTQTSKLEEQPFEDAFYPLAIGHRAEERGENA